MEQQSIRKFRVFSQSPKFDARKKRRKSNKLQIVCTDQKVNSKISSHLNEIRRYQIKKNTNALIIRY